MNLNILSMIMVDTQKVWKQFTYSTVDDAETQKEFYGTRMQVTRKTFIYQLFADEYVTLELEFSTIVQLQEKKVNSGISYQEHCRDCGRKNNNTHCSKLC
jgi:hypothetical protein